MKINKQDNYYRFQDNISNNNSISLITIINKNNKEDFLKLRIINQLLKRRTKKLDKYDFELAKSENYDLRFSNTQNDLHNYLLLEQQMQYISEKFTVGSDFQKQTALFNDYISNNHITEAELEVELAAFKVNYDLLLNDHTRYTRRLAIDSVYAENENYLTLNDELALLETIDVESLKQYYQNLNKEHQYIFHKTNSSEVYQQSLLNNQLTIQRYQENSKYSEVEVVKNIDQAKLNLMYCFKEDYSREKLNVFNAIFGGDAYSKLFVNVREAHSICYYVNSKIINRKVIQVETGVNVDNIELAEKLIDEQITAIQTGNINELAIAKQKLISTYYGMENDYHMRKNLMENQILYGLSADIKEITEAIEDVTKNDIIEMANNIEKIKKVVVK